MSLVVYESTPNPQSMKFIVTDRQIANENARFQNADDAIRSPLARKLFGFPWAQEVFIGPNFVTVTKQDWVDWAVLAEPLSQLIEEHVKLGEAVLLPATAAAAEATEDSPVVQQIKQILNSEIRPAVAMDGGDITFHSYQDGRLYLELQGSCNGCPSSTMTLKEGIESRMKASIPELVEVVSI